MDEQEARRLVRQIEGEPGWHAEAHNNTWTGQWRVRAWLGNAPEDEENHYSLMSRIQWYKLRAALREEAAEAAHVGRRRVMNTAKFYQHLVLHDFAGSYAEADMDEECIDISHVFHDMPIGTNADGAVRFGDLHSGVRLSASDMDTLARAWLRYRVGEPEGGD